ncbi:hypothetical protein, partial [Bosea sp. (in: a-proteobacteria)]|uniref:hypothetical protein n=1 Tax=Bosea sp. (in: a-proteobacteria) TaxID=1871050 RepID=UPI002FC8DE88
VEDRARQPLPGEGTEVVEVVAVVQAHRSVDIVLEKAGSGACCYMLKAVRRGRRGSAPYRAAPALAILSAPSRRRWIAERVRLASRAH